MKIAISKSEATQRGGESKQITVVYGDKEVTVDNDTTGGLRVFWSKEDNPFRSSQKGTPGKELTELFRSTKVGQFCREEREITITPEQQEELEEVISSLTIDVAV